jgi:hypothetical protein
VCGKIFSFIRLKEEIPTTWDCGFERQDKGKRTFCIAPKKVLESKSCTAGLTSTPNKHRMGPPGQMALIHNPSDYTGAVWGFFMKKYAPCTNAKRSA